MNYCDGMYVAVDGIIRRALERAGRKLNNCGSRSMRVSHLTELEAIDFHARLQISHEDIDRWKLLLRCWDYVPVVAERYSLDEGLLRRELDNYCRNLIAAGERHDFAKTCYILNRISDTALA